MISSVSNSRIKNLNKLLSSAKERRQQGVFVTEGVKLFLEAPMDRIYEIYVADSFLTKLSVMASSTDNLSARDERLQKVYEKLSQVDYETVSDDIFNKISETVTPQGILTLVKSSAQAFGDFLSEHETGALRILVLESIQDPGNLGTMLRTSEGAGFDAVLADRGTADVFNPKVIRSTMGTIYRLPIFYVDDLYAALDDLRARDIDIYAAALSATKRFSDISYGERCAIMIGNEGNGLSDRAISCANHTVLIPMAGSVESLNAAVAAALMMYEATRDSMKQ